MKRSRIAAVFSASLAVISLSAFATAQVPSVVIASGDPVPGAPGVFVVGVVDVNVNRVEGYSAFITGEDQIPRYWGNATGGAGGVLRPAKTIGLNKQLYFLYAQATRPWKMDAFGRFMYSAQYLVLPSEMIQSATWFEDAIFIANGDTVLSLLEFEWAAAGDFGFLADGTPHWAGDIRDNGGPKIGGLFIGAGQEVLYRDDDVVPGLAFAISSFTAFSGARFSPSGNHHMLCVVLDDNLPAAPSQWSDAVVMDGAAMEVGGTLLEAGYSVPTSIGGLAGEGYARFEPVAIHDDGSYTITCDTSKGRIVVQNDVIVARSVPGAALLDSPRDVRANSDGDFIYWSQLGPGAFDPIGIFLNGNMILVSELGALNGSPVDVDGDGVVDPGATIGHINDPGSLELSERNLAGEVDVYVVAYVDTAGTPSIFDDAKALVRMTFDVAPGVLVATIDVDPSSCKNALGSVPHPRVVVLGSPELDVLDIDPSTVRLERQDGLGSVVLPVGVRVRMGDFLGQPALPGACVTPGADGFADLAFRFQSAGLLELLRLLDTPKGADVPLILSGELIDGTPFGGRDLAHAEVGMFLPGPGLPLSGFNLLPAQ